MNRRDLLKAAGVAGATVAVRPARGATGKTGEAVDAALSAARQAGASYADVRVVRKRSESLRTRDAYLKSASSSDSLGIGVRVLVKGTWGFAATQDVTAAGARAA